MDNGSHRVTQLARQRRATVRAGALGCRKDTVPLPGLDGRERGVGRDKMQVYRFRAAVDRWGAGALTSDGAHGGGGSWTTHYDANVENDQGIHQS